MTSKKTIGRLSLYRRILGQLRVRGGKAVFSHELAREAGGTAAQVRRDIMALGYSGSPKHGYNIEEMIHSITAFLDNPQGETVALVGVGNLGRALLSYFSGRRPNLQVVAAFDNDPNKTGRVICGCRCYSIEQLAEICQGQKIRVAIITVPGAEAQKVAEELVRAGVRGLLNFAPVPLQAPVGVYVEDMDMTMALEKVAFFARQQEPVQENRT